VAKEAIGDEELEYSPTAVIDYQTVGAAPQFDNLSNTLATMQNPDTKPV
jgi:hypothetical protein